MRATPTLHFDFTQSLLWADYRDEIMLWIEQARDQLESASLDDVKVLQGMLAAYRQMLELPQAFAEEISDGRTT